MWFSIRLEMTFSWSSLRTLYRMALLSLSFFSRNRPLSLSSGDGGALRSSDAKPSSGTLQHTHIQTQWSHSNIKPQMIYKSVMHRSVYLQIQASPGYCVCPGKCRCSMSQRQSPACVCAHTCLCTCRCACDVLCELSRQLKLIKWSDFVISVL